MLKDLLTVEIKFSESHLVFPRIILTILIILGSIIIIKNLIRRYKEGKLTDFKFKFFIDGYDKLKFYGTLVSLIGYVFLLQAIGFLIATIIFVFTTNILFIGNLNRRTLIVSTINSLATSFIFWFILAN